MTVTRFLLEWLLLFDGLHLVSSFIRANDSCRILVRQRYIRVRKSMILSNDNDEKSEKDHNLLDSTCWYSEHKPRRLWDVKLAGTEKSWGTTKPDLEKAWGLGRDDRVEFPSTLSDVVDQAFAAIAGTLYQVQSPDPNIASNAMSRSIFTQRPVRNVRDSGRIGLEIDGVEHLFPNPFRISAATATRRFALLLSAKLSSKESWKPFEAGKGELCSTLEKRTVVVCFNTIKQALAASVELQRLKDLYLSEQHIQSCSSPFDSIKIQCIDDEIPKELHLNQSHRRRNSGLLDGYVNATKGIILVVQPTDYNNEFKPPGPAVDSIGNFQRLTARAAIEEAPIVALSPRFLSNDKDSRGWDQSGYQLSATYGGIEPPNGPTPWIMRDFTPPAYCWIANALCLSDKEPRRTDSSEEQCYLSRVALTQSVMDPGHTWNVFVARECNQGRRKLPTDYIFLASTRSAAGRPPRAVLQQIVDSC